MISFTLGLIIGIIIGAFLIFLISTLIIASEEEKRYEKQDK